MFTFSAKVLGQLTKLGVVAASGVVDDIVGMSDAFDKGYKEFWEEESSEEETKNAQEEEAVKDFEPKKVSL